MKTVILVILGVLLGEVCVILALYLAHLSFGTLDSLYYMREAASTNGDLQACLRRESVRLIKGRK